MKSTQNFLSYEGIVNLKLINERTKRIKKSFTLHNEGTKNLFYFLCNCLLNKIDDTMESYFPASIDVSNSTYSGEGTLNSSLAYRVLFSNSALIQGAKFNYNDGELLFDYTVKFSAIIPFSAFLSGQNTVRCLQLHSSVAANDKIGSLLAYLNFESGITVEDGDALLIEWNMGFLNPSQSSS